MNLLSHRQFFLIHADFPQKNRMVIVLCVISLKIAFFKDKNTKMWESVCKSKFHVCTRFLSQCAINCRKEPEFGHVHLYFLWIFCGIAKSICVFPGPFGAKLRHKGPGKTQNLFAIPQNFRKKYKEHAQILVLSYY